MRIISCLIALLLVQLCPAQQVIRKVVNSPNRTREVYYVLASDSSTLHGRYQRQEYASRTEGAYKNGFQDGIWTVYTLRPKKFIRVQGPFVDGQRQGLWSVYTSKNRLRTKGYFKNDQRVGFWRLYNENGELEEEGNFDKDLRVGKWSFYDDKGDLVQEFDYTARNVISDVSLARLSQTPFRIVNTPDSTTTILQRPPLYVGGKTKLNQSKIIQYDMKTDSVKVEVRFTIEKTGRAINHYVVKSMGYPYDREALFTVKQLPSTWLPAMYKNETVDVEHTLTILFKRVTMKTEPMTYYRDQFRSRGIPSPWTNLRSTDPYWGSSSAFGRTSTIYRPMPALSYRACKVQIL